MGVGGGISDQICIEVIDDFPYCAVVRAFAVLNRNSYLNRKAFV